MAFRLPQRTAAAKKNKHTTNHLPPPPPPPPSPCVTLRPSQRHINCLCCLPHAHTHTTRNEETERPRFFHLQCDIFCLLIGKPFPPAAARPLKQTSQPPPPALPPQKSSFCLLPHPTLWRSFCFFFFFCFAFSCRCCCCWSCLVFSCNNNNPTHTHTHTHTPLDRALNDNTHGSRTTDSSAANKKKEGRTRARERPGDNTTMTHATSTEDRLRQENERLRRELHKLETCKQQGESRGLAADVDASRKTRYSFLILVVFFRCYSPLPLIV